MIKLTPDVNSPIQVEQPQRQVENKIPFKSNPNDFERSPEADSFQTNNQCSKNLVYGVGATGVATTGLAAYLGGRNKISNDDAKNQVDAAKKEAEAKTEQAVKDAVEAANKEAETKSEQAVKDAVDAANKEAEAKTKQAVKDAVDTANKEAEAKTKQAVKDALGRKRKNAGKKGGNKIMTSIKNLFSKIKNIFKKSKKI